MVTVCHLSLCLSLGTFTGHSSVCHIMCLCPSDLHICLYWSLCVTVSVHECVTIYPGASVCVLPLRPQVGVSGPPVPGLWPSPAQPTLAAVVQAGRLFAMSASGKQEAPQAQGTSLPHLCSLLLGLLPAQLGHGPLTCPQPSWTHRPSLGLSLVCPFISVCLSVSMSVSFWGSGSQTF